jgi:hypothetical protein
VRNAGFKVVAPLLLLAGGVFAHAQAVTNPTFNFSESLLAYESNTDPTYDEIGITISANPTVPGWSFSGYYAGLAGPDLLPYPNGDFWHFNVPPSGAGQFGIVGPGSTITGQATGLTPNADYFLSFNLESMPYYPGAIQVCADKTCETYYTTSVTGPHNYELGTAGPGQIDIQGDWRSFGFEFQAGGTTETIFINGIVFNGDGGPFPLTFPGPGAIGIDDVQVPEGGAPSLYALLAGLVCFGAIFASRKQLGSRA